MVGGWVGGWIRLTVCAADAGDHLERGEEETEKELWE